MSERVVMGELMSKRMNISGGMKGAPRKVLVVAMGLALAAGLSGCGFFEETFAVTYEVEVVSGNGEETDLQVEYIDRETGISEYQIVGETVLADEADSATFETLGRVGDDVSISVQAVPDTTLRCAIVLEGSDVIAEQESAPGEAVTCVTTLED